MIHIPKIAKKWCRDQSGTVTVETAIVLTFLTGITAGAMEIGYAFWQWNGAQQAARVGARIAATSPPVAMDLSTMTGLSGNIQTGDPLPDYVRSCSGKTSSCDEGGYDVGMMNRIVYGPNNDGQCGATERLNRGMCDVFRFVSPSNVKIDYESSGLGTAGNPADPAPLITVTVTDIQYNFFFMPMFNSNILSVMPDVHVTVMSEDLKAGA